jgi:hypothetical protein
VLKFMQKIFPAPDLVVKLRAPKEVLLARKQELSPEEIGRQVQRLDSLVVTPARVVTADATLSAEQVARNVMVEITKTDTRC